MNLILVACCLLCAYVALQCAGALRASARVQAQAVRVPPNPGYEPVHFVPLKHAHVIKRKLEQHGYAVVPIGSTNGVYALVVGRVQ